MTLRDLIKKCEVVPSATATCATFATHPKTVAKVATVAVASPRSISNRLASAAMRFLNV
jgi:hypothetical protein